MANIKISELTALTPPAAADLVPVTDSSASQTKRTTVGEIVGIVNGDVDVANDGTATISELPVSKLQDGAARQLLQTDAAGTGVEWTSNVDVPGTLDVTSTATLDGTLNVAGLASLDGGIDVDGAFTVANTSGNIATSGTLGVTGQSTLASAAVSDLTSGRVVLAGTSGELEDNAKLTFNGTQLDVDGDVVITGDLTVEGTSTVLETQTVTVEDKNIELGVVASPTDVTADGGGITLKGTTDKTINWVDATDSWTSSEHVDLASGKSYRINNTEVLSATALGSGVTGSSLTSVGTISSGTWQGTAITDAYLATINTAGKVSNSATTADNVNTANAIVARDASGNFSAGTITATLTGNVSAESGTDDAPSVSVGTTNTGIYSPSTGQLAITTDGDERVRITSDGKVGLGNSLPGAPLTTHTSTASTSNTSAVCELRTTDATLPAGTATANMIRLVANTTNGNTAALIDLGKYEDSSSGRGELKLKIAQTALSSGLAEFSFKGNGYFTAPSRVGIGVTPSEALDIADAGNIAFGTTTGTKIGTATTQKISFYNATPVIQPAAVADATDAASVITQLNDLLAKLRTLGIIAT